jgi:hypothetical protein
MWSSDPVIIEPNKRHSPSSNNDLRLEKDFCRSLTESGKEGIVLNIGLEPTTSAMSWWCIIELGYRIIRESIAIS